MYAKRLRRYNLKIFPFRTRRNAWIYQKWYNQNPKSKIDRQYNEQKKSDKKTKYYTENWKADKKIIRCGQKDN